MTATRLARLALTSATLGCLIATVGMILWFIREWVATALVAVWTVESITDGLILTAAITVTVTATAALASIHGTDESSPILTETERTPELHH